MEITKISHTISGYLNALMLDYIQHAEFTKQFYAADYSVESIWESAEPKHFKHINRQVLVDALLQQNRQIALSASSKGNIELLSENNTYCIATAHQLNIFTGPLYIIYKIVSTIISCRELAKKSAEKNFVPVFVLGSEDHDFDEINHFNLFGKTLQWTENTGGACGRIPTKGFESILQQLKDTMNKDEAVLQLIDLFSTAYNGKNSLAEATRMILNALFGEYGLVILDSDDATLKKLTSPIIVDELLHRSSFPLVQSTDAVLMQKYKEQAHAREINLFYLDNTIRERITWDASRKKFTVLNTALEFDQDAMLNLVNTSPEKFSPNVILRPVFQQAILPSLAYVGGGGELSYWLQLKSTFLHHQIPFPVLLLRNSVLLIDKNTQKKMSKLNVNLQSFFQDEEALVKEFVLSNTDAELSLEEEKNAISKVFSILSEKAKLMDNTLEKTVQAELQNVLNALGRLEGKLLKAQKTKSETEINQVRAIRQKLFPNGVPQERFDNLLAWYTKFGSSFQQTLLNNLDPFSPELTVLFED